MAHNPDSIPKKLQRATMPADKLELVDEEGVPIGGLPGRLIDGSRRTALYPNGVIRTPEAMANILETIIERYNAGAGTVIEKDKLMITMRVGEAQVPEVGEFEMMTMADMSPAVKCEKTGRVFHLSWQHIVELALAAGVHHG